MSSTDESLLGSFFDEDVSHHSENPDGFAANLDVNQPVRPPSTHELAWHEALLDRLWETRNHLNPQATEAYRRQLARTQELLVMAAQQCTDWNIQDVENRTTLLRRYANSLDRCANLQTRLNNEIVQDLETTRARYMGFALGQWLADWCMNFRENPFRAVRDLISDLNVKRLYWVWGSSILGALLDSFSPDFLRTRQAKLDLAWFGYGTGALSFAFYYFRFALELRFAFQYAWNAPDKDGHGQELSSLNRLSLFASQLYQRKFALLNDLLWGPANMFCYLWPLLKKTREAGFHADMVTCGLLLFDTLVGIWELWEEHGKKTREIEEYNTEIRDLRERYEQEENEDEKAYLKRLLLQAEYSGMLCELDLKYNEWQCALKLAYATTLLAAFCCMALLPAIPGAAACFALNTLNEVLVRAIDAMNACEKAEKALAEARRLVGEMADKSPQEQIAYREQIREYRAEAHYQLRLANYKIVDMVHSTVADLVIPVACLAGALFLPLGPSIGIFVAAVALTMVTKMIMDELFKPEKTPAHRFIGQPDQGQALLPE